MRAKKRRNATLIAVAVITVFLVTGTAAYVLTKSGNGPEPAVPEPYRVTIPEGYTNKQTAEKVNSATEGLITAGEFESAVDNGVYDFGFLTEAGGNLEGFLFPKTYDVAEDQSANDLVQMMLEQYEEETEDLDWSSAAVNGVSGYQVLIIASMVEKEAKAPEERPVIASVIYNRLKAGMKLQICATVQYALGEWKPELSYSDLEVDSPYNTYKINGLPPGPICNPGFESISAALSPASTDYIYYILTTNDGRHSFTSDYNQFLRWKEQQGN
ncbi:MAG: endolytic transglycosylase MltG [Actinobacteria bacterium]|nr:endolytic transglycosylase MltG [Actinomycetota bacterium]